MNKINRCSRLIALCSICIMLVVGCTNGPIDILLGNDKKSESTADNNRPKEPENLTIWSMTDSIKYTFESFEKKYNSTITFEKLEGDESLDNIAEVLTKAGEKSPDILVLTQEQMMEMSVQDIAMDLRPIIFRHKEAGYSSYQEALLCNTDKQVKGLAYNVNPILLAYRRSIARNVLGSDDPQVVGDAFGTIEQIREMGSRLKEGQVLFDNPYVMHYFATETNLIDVLEATSQMKLDRQLGTTVNWTDLWLTGMTKTNGSIDSPMTFAYPVPAWAIQQVMMMASVDGVSKNPTSGDWAIANANLGREWDNGFYLVVTKDSQHKGLAVQWIEDTLFEPTTSVAFAIANGHIPSTKQARQMIENNDVDAFLNGQSFMDRVRMAQEAVDNKVLETAIDIQKDRHENQEIEELFVDYVDGKYHTPTEAYDIFMTQKQTSEESTPE